MFTQPLKKVRREKMIESLFTWFNKFFADRQLSRPNGQPLYSYRLSLEEFETLRRLLIREFQVSSWQRPFRNSKLLCAGYLLFGAAHLSRTYENGAWRWSLIDIELNQNNLDPNDHAYAVEKGADYWQLKGLIQDEGKRYLGFLMLQAGIPMRALETESGWASRGINDCLRFLRRYPEAPENVFYQHISQVEYPESFAEDLVVRQLGIASRSLDCALKALTKNSSEQEIATQYENIKNDFPSIAFEAKHLKRFLKARLEDEGGLDGKFIVTRLIRWDSSSSTKPLMEAVASLTQGTETLRSDVLNVWFSNLSGPKPGGNALVLLNNRVFLTLRRHSNDDESSITYSVFSSEKLIFRQEEAAGPMLGLMTWQGGSSAQVVFGNLSAVDPSEPALFVRRSHADDEWRAAGSGSVSTPADHALVLCADDATVTFAEDDNGKASDNIVATRIFRSWIVLNGQSLSLWEIRNDVTIEQSGEVFVIQLRRGDAADRTYWFKGNFAGFTDEGVQIFRGEPEIYCSGSRIRPIWSLPNGRRISSGSIPSNVVLPLRAVHEENGRTLKRLRCVVVPPNARTDIRIQEGTINLRNWNNVEASIDNPGIVVEEDAGLVIRCPRVDNQDELQPFSVLLTPRNPSVYGFWQFRMAFDYPQSIFAFKSQGRNLSRDEIVTIDEIRGVKAYVVTGKSTQQFEAWLELLPDSSNGSDSLGRDYRYVLNFPINQYTSSGTLTYEDFREPLFRLMRLAGKESTVSLRIRTAGGYAKAHIHVTHQTENLRYQGSANTIDCRTTKTHTLQFIPLVDEAATVDPLEVEPGESVLLDRVLPKRTQPWIVFDRDDDKHRLRPLLIPPSDPHCCPVDALNVISEWSEENLANPPSLYEADLVGAQASEKVSERNFFVYEPDLELLEKFEYLQISSLWQGRNLPAEGYKDAERITQAMLSNPNRPDWGVLFRLHKHLNRRGLALLPFWDALQHDVPLALTLAIVLDICIENKDDSRSLVFSLGRYRAWRWDFISVSELVRVLKLVRDFLSRAGYSADSTENRLLSILDLDAAALRPVFKNKLAYALLFGNLITGRDLAWFPDRVKGTSDPFLFTAQNCQGIADKLSDLLRKDPTGARNQLRGAESPGFIGASNIQDKLVKLLDVHDPQALDFARRCGVFQPLSVNAHVDRYLRSVILADYAWARGYDLVPDKPELLFGLAENKTFYNIETIYGVNEQWTAWATSFACAMATAYLLQMK